MAPSPSARRSWARGAARLPAVGALVAALVAAACSAGAPSGAPRSPSPQAATGTASPAAGPFAGVACSLPEAELRRIWAGYDPERSAEIQIVPVEGNYFGNHSHSGPWPYLQRVPLFFYGPGHVPASGRVPGAVTLADVAPTLGEHIGFDFQAPEGRALRETLAPGAAPPRLVVVLVWDGGGRNVLAEHPRAWPVLRRLIPGGVWFDQATVGSSPSVTPAVHTTLGTGAIPRTHGIVDLQFLVDGELTTVRRASGVLRVPTLADLYDPARGNRPVVGLVGNDLTLGMMGVGASREGGDRDVAALHAGVSWREPGDEPGDYEVPPYLGDVGGLDRALRRLDISDGRADGTWMGDLDLAEEKELERTPAFGEHQTAVIEEVVRREGFGVDDVPDLLFVNYKQIDKVAHRWSMNSPQMEAVVRGGDRDLGRLIEALDREVGREGWMLVLTADHGSTPDASVSGGFGMDIRELERDLNEAFDRDRDGRSAIRGTRVTQLWVDAEELEEGGYTLEDVSRFVMRYTKGDNRPDVDPSQQSERLFEAAFPSSLLEADLPCLQAAGSG